MKKNQNLELPKNCKDLNPTEMENVNGGGKHPVRDIQDFLAKLLGRP